MLYVMVVLRDMEPITTERKQSVIKSLAIVGLLGMVFVIAWLAIQIVQVFPTALNSLASLASSVYNYDPGVTRELKINNTGNIVNANEEISLSWMKIDIPGTYTFSYACADGLSLSISTADKAFSDLSCDQSYELGEVTSATITTTSNKERFSDLNYTISFYRTNSNTPAASNSGVLTIVNEKILLASETGATVPDNTPETIATSTAPAEETLAPEVVAKKEPVVATGTKPVSEETTNSTPTKPAVVTTPIYTYEIPVSKSNGTTDLVTSYLGIGNIYLGNIFINTGVVKYNQAGAIQFAVHNVGSKTSKSWTFEAKLPGNITYTSPRQEPLLPNERAVLNLEFPAQSSMNLQNISITVHTDSDTNYANNYVSQSVLVLR